MIDDTSSRIEQQVAELRRENRRRYVFQRMLEATDRVLSRLEELNRDGVTRIPPRVRTEVRELAGAMPGRLSEPLRDTGQVQDTLDSLFEVQERLFRWRHPDWHDFDPDEADGYDSAAS
jgi:hypothetical protein